MPSYSFGPYVLVPERQSLMRGQTAVRIGSRALEILVALIERPGELVSPPPAGVGPHWRFLCAAGRFTIYDDSAEAVLDLATRTWSISPSNFIAAGGDAWPGTSIAGSGASARDGDTAFVMATGRVLSRVGDGDWSLIETNEIEVDQVFATDVAAFAVGADGRTVQEIWHR